MVSELLKRRFNLGEPAELFFWRDNVRHEVDVVFKAAAGLQAIEIKSGTTFARDGPAAALEWQPFAGSRAAQPAIVFGGEGWYERQGCRVPGWRELLSA